MLNRRAFLHGAIFAGLATPVATEGQHAGKVWRIGVMGPGPLTPEIEKVLDAPPAGSARWSAMPSAGRSSRARPSYIG